MQIKAENQGYALTEVLVAAVIASTVIIASMTGMSSAVRGARSADDMQQAVLEASNISARLRAGVPAGNVAEAYPDWHISLSPVDRPVDSRTGAVLTRARLEYAGHAELSLEIIFLEDGARLAGETP